MNPVSTNGKAPGTFHLSFAPGDWLSASQTNTCTPSDRYSCEISHLLARTLSLTRPDLRNHGPTSGYSCTMHRHGAGALSAGRLKRLYNGSRFMTGLVFSFGGIYSAVRVIVGDSSYLSESYNTSLKKLHIYSTKQRYYMFAPW